MVPGPNAAARHERVTRALSIAHTTTGMDVAVIGEVLNGHEVVRYLAGDGASFGLSIGVSTPIEATFCQRLLEGRMSGIVRDARTDEHARDLELSRGAQIRAYLGVPITAEDARLYVLCCLAHEQQPQLSKRDLAFLRGLGESVRGELAMASV